ncbi:hypothetical protein MNBD_GAMMA04-1913, partial [hydrothermal vent metagenome]
KPFQPVLTKHKEEDPWEESVFKEIHF